MFEILTTKGVIGPHSTGKIFVNFSPLEARLYRIKLNVHIMDGASQEIELSASGFDPRAPPAEEEDFLTDCSRITPSAGFEILGSRNLNWPISILECVM